MRAGRKTAPAVTAGGSVAFVSNGRTAIFHALNLLGVGQGDRVLVPTYHCPTMIAPVTRVGALPVFYPVNASAGANLDWLSKAETSGVKALLAVHFFGLPQAMDDVRQYCNERGIALIEDCAHAFFGSAETGAVGTFGDFAIASLPKFFPVMEGGCLVGPAAALEHLELSEPDWLVEFRTLLDTIEVGAQHGRFGAFGAMVRAMVSMKRSLRTRRGQEQSAMVEGSPGDHRTWLDETTLRCRSTATTRWIVRHTDAFRLIERRRANYALWSRLTSDLPEARVLFPELPQAAAPYVFPLQVRDPEAKYQALRAQGVPIFRWDIAWPGIPSLEGDEGRGWLTEVFQLGCHQDLAEPDVAQMASVVRRVLSV
jgi:perosamine synthetase